MKVTYRVFDTETNIDITEDYCWVIQDNGHLSYVDECGYFLTYPSAKAIFTIEEDANAR